MRAEASALARAFTRDSVCVEHHAAVLGEAQLLVSELVTNCVRYASSPIVLEISCDGSAGLQVRVRDSSPVAPQLTRVGPQAESGRGLALVDHISTDWGVQPTDAGKAIWFTLARP